MIGRTNVGGAGGGAGLYASLILTADDELVFGKTVTFTGTHESLTSHFSSMGVANVQLHGTGAYIVECEGYSMSITVTDIPDSMAETFHVPTSTIDVHTLASSWYGTSVVLALNGTTVQTKTFDNQGDCSFKVYTSGNYSVTSNGKTSTVTVVLDTDYSIPLNPVETVPFSTGTWAQLSAMLEAHYNNEINLADYWAVGNTRSMSLSAISASQSLESQPAQTVEIVIMDFDHDDLVTPINGHTKSAVTIGLVNCLSNKGKMNLSRTNAEGWNGSNRRAWIASGFKGAIPSEVRSNIKTVKKYSSSGSGSSTIQTTNDDIFLVSQVEVDNSYDSSYEGEGYKYPYFTSSTRIKTVGGTASGWWMRSPNKNRPTSDFVFITSTGSRDFHYADVDYGISPAFCM